MKRLEAFPMDRVRLVKGSLAYRKTMKNVEYMFGMDPDRLLYNFRRVAGLDTLGAEPYGSWEAWDFPMAGHFTGHYITALCRLSVVLKTVEPFRAQQCRERAEYFVNAVRECQDSLAKTEEHAGYVAGVPSSRLDWLEACNFQGTHYVPYYNYHKLLMGLISAYQCLGSQTALEIAKGLADYFVWRIGRLPKEQVARMINTRWYNGDSYVFHQEFGGIGDALLLLYEITGEERYLSLAKVFDRDSFREMLVQDRDLLGYYAHHANTEIPVVMAMARYYDITGEEEYRSGTLNFMNWMRTGHQIATGGVSGRAAYPHPVDYDGELFEFPGMLYKHTSKNSGESCCSHNLNELSRELLEWTGDPVWAAEYDKRFVNAVLSQQHSRTGGFVYNLCVGQGKHKDHSVDGFFCCNGSGVEYHTGMLDGIYFQGEGGLWIARYFESDLCWPERGMVLRQRTAYPDSGTVRMEIQMQHPAEFPLHLMMPEWMDRCEIRVNGELCSADVCPGRFLTLSRLWQDGDCVELNFNYTIRIELMDDRREMAAVYYGPQLLVACTKGFAVFSGTAQQLKESLQPAAVPCEFQALLTTGKVAFKPLSHVDDEEYNGYTIVSRPPEKVFTDSVVLADIQSETAHSFACSASETGEYHGLAWRESDRLGWLCYTLRVKPGQKMYLHCIYSGDEPFGELSLEETRKKSRLFFLEAQDGDRWAVFGAQTLAKEKSGGWYDINYPIPEELTRGREQIVIRFRGAAFESNEPSAAGKLFGEISAYYYPDSGV